MSDIPVHPLGEEAALLRALLPDSAGPVAVGSSETVEGRLILRDSSVPATGGEPFRELRLEIVELAQVLDLTAVPRVYEEVSIRKDVVTRVETVAAVLRREEAEVTTEDEPGEDGPGEDRSGADRGRGQAGSARDQARA